MSELLPNPCQHIVSISGDFGGQRDALDDTDGHSQEAGSDDASRCDLAPCGTKKQNTSVVGR